ncbi:WXG100 family type VII secretion target [Streptomyces sp. NPDC001843]|uniref:WXG100 family type VII secretion target n=1 Tax=Streptomyces sp. NPDC001843 TaxID=3364617 RepID=UPI0036D11D90
MNPNLEDGLIHVEYRYADNAADDMVNQTRAIEGTLSSLEEELNELKKTWQGDDAEIYKQKQAAWDAAMVAMENLLDSNAALLNDVVGQYKYTEQSLTNLWSEVTIGR